MHCNVINFGLVLFSIQQCCVVWNKVVHSFMQYWTVCTYVGNKIGSKKGSEIVNKVESKTGSKILYWPS